jgi:hypothetical protein
MNRFLRYTFWFLVPILLGGVLLEIALRAVPNGYGFKKAYLDAHKGRIETLVLGSSHGYYNIDPQYIEGNAFNAANPAQSLRYDMLMLEGYIVDMPKLQTVILPVGYPTLFFEVGHTPESWRLTHYARDFGFPIAPDHFQYQFFVLSKMLKWNLEDIETHYFKNGKVYKMSELGWGTDYGGNREGKIEKSAKASIFWHTSPTSPYIQDNKIFLEAIARACAQRGVRLLIVHTPLHQAYRERMDPVQSETTKRILSELGMRYPNMKVLDFSGSEDFDGGDFYDGDHLNELGAKKLSEKINLAIKQSKSGN